MLISNVRYWEVCHPFHSNGRETPFILWWNSTTLFPSFSPFDGKGNFSVFYKWLLKNAKSQMYPKISLFVPNGFVPAHLRCPFPTYSSSSLAGTLWWTHGEQPPSPHFHSKGSDSWRWITAILIWLLSREKLGGGNVQAVVIKSSDCGCLSPAEKTSRWKTKQG